MHCHCLGINKILPLQKFFESMIIKMFHRKLFVNEGMSLMTAVIARHIFGMPVLSPSHMYLSKNESCVNSMQRSYGVKMSNHNYSHIASYF